MGEYLVKWPRHLGELKRLDEQPRVSDLPPPAAAHEAPQLLLASPSLPGSLLLEGAEDPSSPWASTTCSTEAAPRARISSSSKSASHA